MNLEIDKIKNAALYLAKNIPNLYVTKFLKLMYYFDFISVIERGRPITNDNYYHLPYGPVPSFAKDQIALLKEKKFEDEMLKDDGIEEGSVISIFSDLIKLNRNEDKNIMEAQKDPDLSYLSDYEQGLLKDLVAEFRDISTTDLVKKTHQEFPYIQTLMNDKIDYKLAFYLNRGKILPKRNFEFNAEISQVDFLSEK